MKNFSFLPQVGAALLLAAGGGLALLPTNRAYAETESVDGETIVYATRAERAVADVPLSISVVGKDDIQLGRQQLGIDESLIGIPGLFVQGRYNFAQDLRIAIRGFGARSNFGIRGVKIIVDGIPETLPDGQGQVDGIDIGSIERIEVLKGPASSLYGNASGGVVNILSEKGPASPFVETRLSFGSDNFSKFQFKTGGESGRINYMFDISQLDYDGYRQHSETENTQFNSRIAFNIDNSQHLLMVFNTTDQPIANDPGGITEEQALSDPRSARDRNVAFGGGEALEQQKLGLVYTKEFNDAHQLKLRNYYVNRDFSNQLPFVGGGAVGIDRTFIGGGVEYTFDGNWLGRTNKLVAGLDIDQQDDDRTRFDNNNGVIGDLVFDQNEEVSSFGVFAQNEFFWHDDFTLTIGMRYDRVTFDVTDRFLDNGDDSGKRTLSEVSPMIGMVYTATPTLNVYANVSTAFETPTTTEFANPSGLGGFNPGLDPQLATNYEIGIKGSLGEKNKIEMALFQIDVEDELVPFELAARPGRDFFSNAGSSSRSGIEFSLVSQPIKGLRASLAYTYSDFKFDSFVDDNGNDFSGLQLPGIPKHLINAELNYTHESGFFSSLEILSVDDMYVNNSNSTQSDGYVVSNLRFGINARRGAWEFSPFVGVNNIFDEDYFGNVRINAFGGRFFEPAPQRNIYAGIGIRYDF